MRRLAITFAAAGLAVACAHADGRDAFDRRLRAHTGHGIDATRTATMGPEIPAGVVVDDGLSADEAVAIALWNSPGFRVELARLTAAEAELAAAKRPSNPTLRVLFPAGPQQLSVLLTWPLETLVTLPRRVKVARKNLASVAEAVVQIGVDLARDVKLAHVEWVLARDRVAVREALSRDGSEIAAIVQARANAGDVPGSDADAAQTDARVAADEAARAHDDVAIAQLRLEALLGGVALEGRAPIADEPPPTSDATDVAAPLLPIALSSRPDLRAAQLAIETAALRIGLERAAVLSLAGVAYGVGSSYTGGVQGELPIASQNQLGIGRAKAQLEAARWRARELELRITAEVVQAQTQWRRARRSWRAYEDDIVAARTRELAAATAQFELGESDYAGVLLSAQRLETTKLRAIELVAEIRRAHAELERAVGRRLDAAAAVTADEGGAP